MINLIGIPKNRFGHSTTRDIHEEYKTVFDMINLLKVILSNWQYIEHTLSY